MNIGDIRDFGVVTRRGVADECSSGHHEHASSSTTKPSVKSLDRWCHGANARHTTATISVCLRCEIAACGQQCQGVGNANETTCGSSD